MYVCVYIYMYIYTHIYVYMYMYISLFLMRALARRDASSDGGRAARVSDCALLSVCTCIRVCVHVSFVACHSSLLLCRLRHVHNSRPPGGSWAAGSLPEMPSSNPRLNGKATAHLTMCLTDIIMLVRVKADFITASCLSELPEQGSYTCLLYIYIYI